MSAHSKLSSEWSSVLSIQLSYQESLPSSRSSSSDKEGYTVFLNLAVFAAGFFDGLSQMKNEIIIPQPPSSNHGLEQMAKI